MQRSYLELQAIIAAMYPERNFILVPYGYTASLASSLAAAATQTNQLTVTGNADFLCTQVAYHASLAGAAQTAATKVVAQCRLLVTDSGSQNQWTQAAVDLENFCLGAGYDRGLDWPRLVRGRSTLTLQLTNYSAAETYTVLDLYFSGVLIYVT